MRLDRIVCRRQLCHHGTGGSSHRPMACQARRSRPKRRSPPCRLMLSDSLCRIRSDASAKGEVRAQHWFWVVELGDCNLPVKFDNIRLHTPWWPALLRLNSRQSTSTLATGAVQTAVDRVVCPHGERRQLPPGPYKVIGRARRPARDADSGLLSCDGAHIARLRPPRCTTIGPPSSPIPQQDGTRKLCSVRPSVPYMRSRWCGLLKALAAGTPMRLSQRLGVSPASMTAFVCFCFATVRLVGFHL